MCNVPPQRAIPGQRVDLCGWLFVYSTVSVKLDLSPSFASPLLQINRPGTRKPRGDHTYPRFYFPPFTMAPTSTDTVLPNYQLEIHYNNQNRTRDPMAAQQPTCGVEICWRCNVLPNTNTSMQYDCYGKLLTCVFLLRVNSLCLAQVLPFLIGTSATFPEQQQYRYQQGPPQGFAFPSQFPNVLPNEYYVERNDLRYGCEAGPSLLDMAEIYPEPEQRLTEQQGLTASENVFPPNLPSPISSAMSSFLDNEGTPSEPSSDCQVVVPLGSPPTSNGQPADTQPVSVRILALAPSLQQLFQTATPANDEIENALYNLISCVQLACQLEVPDDLVIPLLKRVPYPSSPVKKGSRGGARGFACLWGGVCPYTEENGKLIRRFDHAKNHVREHIKSKPYMCGTVLSSTVRVRRAEVLGAGKKICRQRFLRMDDLKRHRINHTKRAARWVISKRILFNAHFLF